jgi:hypothetical protein
VADKILFFDFEAGLLGVGIWHEGFILLMRNNNGYLLPL